MAISNVGSWSGPMSNYQRATWNQEGQYPNDWTVYNHVCQVQKANIRTIERYTIMFVRFNLNWLVVGPPLWKIWFPIYGKIINDPNHQLVKVCSTTEAHVLEQILSLEDVLWTSMGSAWGLSEHLMCGRWMRSLKEKQTKKYKWMNEYILKKQIRVAYDIIQVLSHYISTARTN